MKWNDYACMSCWLDLSLVVSPVLLLAAPDSFSYKKFFQLIGLTKKSPEEVRDVFRLLDDNNSGFIEESELKYVYFIFKFIFNREVSQ